MALLPGFKTIETYKIRTYDIDYHKRVTIPALVQLMHETAMSNVIDLKLSVWDLEPQGISWVLMRKKLDLFRLPILGETIHVHTYPAGFEKFFTYRDYLVYDETKQLIAQAATTWLLMDTTTRKMTRIPDFILKMEMPEPEQCLPRQHKKLTKIKHVDWQRSFQVGWHDLDFNKHLNNLLYLRWVLETLPDELLLHNTPETFNILYKLECQWKEKIHAETEQINEMTFRHRLVRLSDKKEVVLAETKWKPQNK